MIPKKDCKDRHLYKIRSRNLAFGIYREETGGFIGIRSKFGSEYLFEEYHRDNGAPYGTVTPQAELTDVLPAEISMKMGDSVCHSCDREVGYIPWPEGGSREVAISDNTKIKVTGQWQHIDDKQAPCMKIDPIHKENAALRNWLEDAINRFYKTKIHHPADDPEMGLSAARPTHTS